MPCTPWRKMSSASLNASESGVFFSTTCRRRSFSITISVSTLSESSLIPTSACCGAASSFERERPRHDTDGQRLELARDLGHDRRAARTRAAAFSCGDEDHVGALQRLLQLVARLGRRLAPDVRVGARAETARRLRADVDLHVGVAAEKRLRVGVHGDELDAREPRVDHAVDGVRPAAADADDLDHSQVVAGTFSHVNVARPQARVQGGAVERLLPSAGYGRFPALSTAERSTSTCANPQAQPAT